MAKTPKTDTPQIDKPEIEETSTPAPVEKGGGEPSPAGLADLGAIADDLSASLPDVQSHAIEQELAQQEERRAEWADLKDRDGNPFDPDVHQTNAAGEPVLTPAGNLKKRPGRKAGQKPGNKEKPRSVIGSRDSGQDAGPSPDMQREQQARIAGVGMANLFIAANVMLWGDEWTPRQGTVKIGDQEIPIDEKAQLESVFADYCVATGQQDLPPGLALAAGMLMYAAPRFSQPKTKARCSGIVQAVKKWWANRKLKKHGLKAEKIDKPEKERS